MNSKTIPFALLISMTLISCAQPTKLGQATQTPQTSREIEEAAIYELLIENECSSYSRIPVFIVNQTIPEISFDKEGVFERRPSIETETFDQFIEINQTSQAFSPDLADYKFCEIIAAEELNSLTQGDPNWYNDHLVISFSGVGFNTRLDEALVYREYNCGGECAGGDLYFLIRHEYGPWFIVESVGGWRS